MPARFYRARSTGEIARDYDENFFQEGEIKRREADCPSKIAETLAISNIDTSDLPEEWLIPSNEHAAN